MEGEVQSANTGLDTGISSTPALQAETPIENEFNPENAINEIEQGLNVTAEPEVTPEKEIVNPENPEQQNLEVNPEKEMDYNKEFNVDDLDMDEEFNKKIVDDYDLTSFKDLLDFDSPEAMEVINEEIAKIKELGFNQQQAEYYIKSHLDAYQESIAEEREMYSAKNTIQRLNEKLTREEKMNYKPIVNWLKSVDKDGTIPKQWLNDVMGNPNLVKMLNVLYKGSLNGRNNVVEQPVTNKRVTSISPLDVRAKWQEWITKENNVTKEKSRAFLDEYKQYISKDDMEDFNKIFSTIYK